MLGETTGEKRVLINCGEESVLDIDTPTLLGWWESSSDRLEQEQMNVSMAKEQTNYRERTGINYTLTFEPESITPASLRGDNRPKVAIIRDEGSNGDREMTSAFYWAGFETWDVTMTDVLEECVSLDEFRGVVFVGGFSYADVLDPAKGWAGIIKFNPRLKKEFDDFFNRKDTFTWNL